MIAITRLSASICRCSMASSVLRGMDLADQVEHLLQEPQPAGAAVGAQIARHAGDRRSEHREDQHAVEDIVAVFVEEGLLIVVQIIQRALMHQDVGILVGRRRLDLDLAGKLRGDRQSRRVDHLRKVRDVGVVERFARHQIFGES